MANQFFALNVVSLYFVRWLTLEKQVPAIYYSAAFGIASFCVAVCSPLFGALSDYTKRRRIFLVIFTFISVGFTMLIGTTASISAGLIFFALAFFGCHMGVVFYNALLSDIVSVKYVGLVSGIGRMFGYSGALVALYLIKPIVIRYGYQATFIPTGLMFLIFAAPCMLFVRDSAVADKRLPWRHFFAPAALSATFHKLRRALFIGAGPESYLPYFLRATFFSLAAVNTVILFMSIYATIVFALSETQIIHLIAFSAFFAIFGSIISGALSDYVGQKRFLAVIFMLWIGCLLFGALLSESRFYLLLGALVGFALGAIWVVLRAFLIKITPAAQVGEAFGLFNLMGYLSGIAGTLFWGIMLLALRNLGSGGYRITLAALTIFLFVGLSYLMKIPSVKRPGHIFS